MNQMYQDQSSGLELSWRLSESVSQSWANLTLSPWKQECGVGDVIISVKASACSPSYLSLFPTPWIHVWFFFFLFTTRYYCCLIHTSSITTSFFSISLSPHFYFLEILRSVAEVFLVATFGVFSVILSHDAKIWRWSITDRLQSVICCICNSIRVHLVVISKWQWSK